MLRKTVELLKLCNTPVSIISPFPLFAVILFLISHKEFQISDLYILFVGIIISMLSNFSSNLWNHSNDIKEDIAQGRKTVLIRDISMQKRAPFISILLYTCSILLVFYLSNEFKRQIYIYFLIWSLATWWYSDNLILKKVIGFRLKDHYIGELITYSIAWPTYTLSIWLIYSDLNIRGVMTAISLFFLSISGLLLKDIKDISGDRATGLKTFGVVFLPSQLIRYSCYLMVLYYLIILNPFTLKFFGAGILIMVIPFVYFLKKTFFHMRKKHWTLDRGDLKPLQSMGNSALASFIFMGLSIFL